MSEFAPETSPNPSDAPEVASTTAGAQAKNTSDSSRPVAITAIVAVTVVSLCCIISCTVVMYAFVNNPPW